MRFCISCRNVGALSPLVLPRNQTRAGLEQPSLAVKARFNPVEALRYLGKPIAHFMDEQLYDPLSCFG